MDIQNLDKYPETEDSSGRAGRKLRLNTIENVKKSLARLIRDIDAEDKPDLARYRVQAQLLGILLNAFKIDFETRLERLEDIFNESEKTRE